MTAQVMVLRVFTTRAAGKRRWICSPSESVFVDEKGGRSPLREVERVRDVDQDLAGQVLLTRQLEHGDRGPPRWSR